MSFSLQWGHGGQNFCGTLTQGILQILRIRMQLTVARVPVRYGSDGDFRDLGTSPGDRRFPDRLLVRAILSWERKGEFKFLELIGARKRSGNAAEIDECA